MKKQIAILATIVATSGLSAFGQGYVVFSAPAGYVYDEFTTPTTSVKSSTTAEVAFLWAATGTADPLGAGLSTTAPQSGANGYSLIAGMLSSGWSIGLNGAAQAATATEGSFSAGGFSYGGGSSFALANSTAGSSYEFVAIAWNASAGSTFPSSSASAFGWSSAFTYATGSSSGATVNSFPGSGMTAFGVAPVPEPTTLALAGLGGLSMLFLRRRKA